jgi:hypothetical protein
MSALKGKIWIIPEEVNTQNFYKEVMAGDNFNTGIREFVSKYQLGLEVEENPFISSYLLANIGYLVMLEDILENDVSIYIPANTSSNQLNFIKENRQELMKNKIIGYAVTDSASGSYSHLTDVNEILNTVTNRSMFTRNEKKSKGERLC